MKSKSLQALILALILSFTMALSANAQGAETIWLTGSTTEYKTGETVVVTVNAATAVPIQGINFLIRYDPNCLEPIDAVSTVPSMNKLGLPQTEAGVFEAAFTSTTPQSANGTLAEVRFKALAGCQTALTLESATLAIRDTNGFAAEVPGLKISGNNIALNIDQTVGISDEAQTGSDVIVGAATTDGQGFPRWAIILIALPLIAGVAFGAFKWLQKEKSAPVSNQQVTAASAKPAQSAFLQYKHGPQAGKSISLNGHPILLGSADNNDICVSDPNVIDQHAKIFSKNNRYYLTDLGGETYLNGQAIQQRTAALKSGDVIRLGKRALFMFGA